MKTIGETLSLATAFLGNRRDVEEIFAFVLGFKRIDIYLQHDRPLVDQELDQIRAVLKRVKREPLEYVLGQVEFYGCHLEVTQDVLIPRPETEIMVDLIVKRLKGVSLEKKELWDLCSGSGCIGLALKRAYPQLHVVLSDLSTSALNIAKRNAEKNQLTVEFLQGDLLQPFAGRKADFFVCNPPYVSKNEYDVLDERVRMYEPPSALIAGERGTEFYERFSQELSHSLNPGASLFFEIGSTQGEKVKKLFPCQKGEIIKDFAGHDRFFFLLW